MKVKAISLGFYNGKLRPEGTEFSLVKRDGKNLQGKPVKLNPSEQFSERWMEKVGKDKEQEAPETTEQE